jgi:hypothetical protein
MNKTFGDLMGEYSAAKDVASRFKSWDQMDQLVESLIAQVAPRPQKRPTEQFQEYSFDANGSAIPHEENNG